MPTNFINGCGIITFYCWYVVILTGRQSKYATDKKNWNVIKKIYDIINELINDQHFDKYMAIDII